MKPLFDRLRVWLAQHAPAVLADLRPPATAKQIRAAEKAMGVILPDDVKAAYRIHDGQTRQDLFDGWPWLPLEDVVHLWGMMKAGCAKDGPPAAVPEGAEVRTDYWHPAWIPLAWGGRGDRLFLDLDPPPAGKVGQILLWWKDLDPPASVEMDSFADFLEALADDLESGELTTHPDYAGLVRVGEILDE
jgi:cell wall assembly regulator SMI1